MFRESRLYGTLVSLYCSTSGSNCCGEDPAEELLLVVVEAVPTREPLMMLPESVEVAEIAAEFGGGRWERIPPPLPPVRAAVSDDGVIVVLAPAAAAAEPARSCHAAAQMTRSCRKRRRMAPAVTHCACAWGAWAA